MRIFARLKQRLKADFPQLFHILKQAYAMRPVGDAPLLYKISALAKFLLPRRRLREYTLNSTIPIRYNILDGRRDEQRPTAHITQEVYTRTLSKIRDNTFTYYGDTYTYLQLALNAFPIVGKTVIIYGLEWCNCDMISINNGASKVYVIDYQPPHPQLLSFSVDDFEKQGLQADVALSISSFEHDGLGRYGDPMQPNADLRAMQQSKKHLKKDGLLFLAVPVGADCLVYNAHRIYGKIRLPMLLEGWETLASYGFSERHFDEAVSSGVSHQPVFVLKNS